MNKLLLIAALLFAAPAMADTDYVCLNTCVRGGATSQACMAQCTFNAPVKALDLKQKAKKDPYDQFDTLRPQERVTLKRDLITNGKLNKDYTCMTQCLKGGMQYQLCEAQCTTAK